MPLITNAAQSVLLVAVVASLAAAQSEPQLIQLWDGGAPGFESRKDEPEQSRDW